MKKYVVSDAECSVKSDLEEPRIFKMGVEKDREKSLTGLRAPTHVVLHLCRDSSHREVLLKTAQHLSDLLNLV